MQNVVQHKALLSTGSWLVKERQRLGWTRAEVSRAVQSHSGLLRSIEDHNLVFPPGWYPALCSIGMQVQEPVWPTLMPSYYGAELNQDLRTVLQHSRFWLSKQLCVPENDVNAVIHGNHPVPGSWLLKLAELGANVPAPVRMALHSTIRKVNVHSQASAQNKPADSFRGEHVEKQTESARSCPPHSKERIETPTAEPKLRERFSIFFHWSEESGVHLSVDAPSLTDAEFRAVLGITDLICDAAVILGPSIAG